VSPQELRRRRAGAQLLHRPAGSGPAGIVGRLLAVQSQDLRSARLALRARGSGFTAADVDDALTRDRSLVVGWLFRGTLHLVRAEDYPWLSALTAPADPLPNRRRLAQEGVSAAQAEAAVEVVGRALAAEGPLLRAELGERLRAAGIPSRGQALPHLLALAAWRGIAVLGPVRDGQQAFALTRDWLGQAPVPLAGEARERWLAELARRYLAGHAPAGAEDLAAWSGLPLRDVRTAMAADPPQEQDVREVPAGLLPALDPYLLGWRDRSFAVPQPYARRVHPGGGVVRATAAVDGLAVGTWTARRSRGRLAVRIEPFRPLPQRARAALAADAEDVARFEEMQGSVAFTGG